MKTRNIGKSLKKKGFEEFSKGKDHKYFYFMKDSKRTSIFTKMSHSHDEISDKLQKAMSSQMKLSIPQFKTFVECTMTGEKYRKHLEENGHL